MNKQEKLQAIRDIAWEMLKFPPSELKKQGINPINLVGANFSAKEMMEELGIDVNDELNKRK